MNLQVLTWLVKHRELLMAVVKEASKFDRSAPYIQQWDVVDRIARIVIPVLQAENISPEAFWEYTAMSLEDGDVQLLSAGAEVQAMNIDWRTLIDVIMPVVIAILQSLMKK
jgi:hypothetical protein